MKKKLVALLAVGAVVVSGIGTALAAEPALGGQASGIVRLQAPSVRLRDLAFERLGSNFFDNALFGQTRATESLTWTIKGGTTTKASTAFPMETEETVTINCSYSPSNALVDFGLIAPDNKFYYLSGEKGSINQTIIIPNRGDYYFAVRNRSTSSVEVRGFVNY